MGYKQGTDVQVTGTINMQQHELLRPVLENLSADPPSPKQGQIYFNTISKKKRTFNGTTWEEDGSGGGGSGFLNPMATPGDLIVGGINGAPTRLASNTTPTVNILTSANSLTEWEDVSSLYNNASYTALIGNGSSTTISVTHNLGTESIICGVWEASGLKRSVECSVSIVSANIISVHFTTAPLTDSLRIIIISSIFSSAIHTTPELPNQTGHNAKFLTTNGTSVSWGVVPPELPNQAGHNAEFLTTNGSTVSWSLTPAWLTNPMSSPGDIIVGGTGGLAGRLAHGTDNQVLTVSGTSLVWTTQIPTLSGNSGKLLTNNGTITQWQTFYEIPAISGPESGKILSNNGSVAQWVANTNPPTVTGQSGKFLGNDGNSTLWYSISQVPSTVGQAGKVLTNDGSSYSWNTLVSVLPTVTGNTGKFLTTNGTTIAWDNPPSGFSNPMSAQADIIVGDTAGAAIRLGHGTDGQALTSVFSGGVWSVQWTTINTLANPMTTAGDLIVGGTSGAATRLGIGATGSVLYSNGSNPYWTPSAIVPSPVTHSGQYLTSDGTNINWTTLPSGLPTQTAHNGEYLTTNGTTASWSAIPSGFANPMTTLGDLIAGNSGGVAGRVAIGSTGQVLTVVAGGPAWASLIGLPTQTGHNGQHLSTDGTTATWTQIYQVPSVTSQSGKFLGNDGSTYSWLDLPNQVPSVSGQSGKYLSNNGASVQWVPYAGLPSITGMSGKILSTDGSTAFWIDPAGGSGVVLSQIPITVTSSTLAVLGKETKTVDTTCKTFEIHQITASNPCRIRVYGNPTFAAADYSRTAATDPTGNHGMYLEMIFTSTSLSWVLTPIPTCTNTEATRTTNTYITIENNDTVSAAIVLNLTLMKKE